MNEAKSFRWFYDGGAWYGHCLKQGGREATEEQIGTVRQEDMLFAGVAYSRWDNTRSQRKLFPTLKEAQDYVVTQYERCYDADWEYAGTVVQGSLKSDDIIRPCMAMLKLLNQDTYEELLDQAETYVRILGAEADNLCKITAEGHEAISVFVTENIWEAMNTVTPDGYYFGAHPGDGADLGFWKEENDGQD